MRTRIGHLGQHCSAISAAAKDGRAALRPVWIGNDMLHDHELCIESFYRRDIDTSRWLPAAHCNLLPDTALQPDTLLH